MTSIGYFDSWLSLKLVVPLKQDMLMDKRLVSPYKPASSIILSDKEILEIEQYKIPLTLEIQKMTKKTLKKGNSQTNGFLK